MHQIARVLLNRMLVVAYCAMLPMATEAVGLGGVKVHSALGQPLSAEIEVTAIQAEEFSRVLAGIAKPEQYQVASLLYVPVLRQLRINPERRADGGTFLNITSVVPIYEPTLVLLIDFNWGGGRLLQKYSILLDPPK
ncbi:MAG: hypothetical protein WCL29_05480 [Pseudomonadota bacterium]